MSAQTCNFCNDPAQYSCECIIPEAFFCKKHQDDHENTPASHLIKPFKHEGRFRKPLPENKKLMIEKIMTTKGETMIQIDLILKISAETIDLIEKEREKYFFRLKAFMDLCDEVIAHVENLTEIDKKFMNSPLEHVLLSKNIQNFLSLIYSPQIFFPQINSFFTYKPSAFPHAFFNSSENTVGYSDINNLVVRPLNKNISDRKLSNLSSCLFINNDFLLVTGGGNDERSMTLAFMVNLQNKNITQIASMDEGRKKHSMAWMENCPVVIGGFGTDASLVSVEMLKNNFWTKVDALNQPRNSATSINVFDEIYIFGGVNMKIPLNSIEVYFNKTWRLLTVVLPQPCYHVGLCFIEKGILLVGGVDHNYKIVKNLQYFDIEKERVIKLPDIDGAAAFNSSHFVVGQDKVESLGQNEKGNNILVGISLEKMFQYRNN